MAEETHLIRDILFSLIFVGCGNFLCLFTVRENVRINTFSAILLTLAQCLIYYAFRRISWLGMIPYLGLAFLLYKAVTNIRPLKLLYLMLIVITYLLFSNAMLYVFEGSSYTWTWDDMPFVLMSFAITMPIVTWFLRKKLWPIVRNLHSEGVRGLWIIPTSFIIMNALLCSSHIQSLLNESLSIPYTMMTSVFAIASSGACFLMLDMLKKTQDVTRYEDEIRMVDMQLAMQHSRFNELTRYMDTVRVLRHDMRHHMRMIKSLAAEGKEDLLLEYLNEYENTVQQQESIVYSQNYVGDIIARRSQERADALGIDNTIHCSLPADCWISDIDLCVLLGNLMDNALNACALQKAGKRHIIATAKLNGPEAQIHIENSCNAHESTDEEKIVAGVPIGSGQGIPSIQAVAQKYGGTAVFQKEGNKHVAIVLLYRPAGWKEGQK